MSDQRITLDNGDEINIDNYFGTLSKLYKHASKIQRKENDEEEKLMQYLPLNERFNMNKESKVLTRWQERQKEWEKIQQVINKKINSKVSRPLMMATSDEYRSRMEEYDLIQAAIPIKDKFASSAWEMGLRGGAPIRISVGHLFSGLECEIDPKVVVPKMIRKPKTANNVWKSDSFLDQTEAYLTTRKKYEHSINNIRPHNLSYNAAEPLVIQSKNLYAWAKDSSMQYLKQKRDEEASLVDDGEEELRQMQELQRIEEEKRLAALPHPQLDFLSTRNVYFQTIIGKEIVKPITIRNSGQTTLYYRWKRVELDNHPPTASAKHRVDAPSLKTTLKLKRKNDPALLTDLLTHERDSFFCLKESGEILPNEETQINFSFLSQGLSGTFTTSWVFEITPYDTKIFVNGSSEPMTGTVPVHFTAHCTEPDEHEHRRAFKNKQVELSSLETFMKDMVLDCVRRVRIPIRMNDVHGRQVEFFRNVNTELFNKYFKSHDVLPPIFLNPSRIKVFEDLKEKSALFYYSTIGYYRKLLRGENIESQAISVPQIYEINDEDNTIIHNTLFPEKYLEIFDEVERKDIIPPWDYKVHNIIDGLENLRAVILHLEQVEKHKVEREALELKERIKAEKLAAKLALKKKKKKKGKKKQVEEDEEEEEEEEEEEPEPEEPEEEDPLKEKPKHPLLVEMEKIWCATMSQLFSLLAYPMFTKPLEDIARIALCSCFDNFTDWQQAALEAAGITEMVTAVGESSIPSLPNPFASEDGRLAWETALQLTSPIPEVVGKGAKAAKPKKGDPPPVPTQQQGDFYHKELVQNMKVGILNSGGELFEKSSHYLKSFASSLHQTHPMGKIDLGDVSIIRKEDVESKIVFFTFDPMILCGPAYVNKSAFPLMDIGRAKLVDDLRTILTYNPKAIILICEADGSPYTSTDSYSVLDQVQLLVDPLQKSMLSYQHHHRRELKQAKVRHAKDWKVKNNTWYLSKNFIELFHTLDSLLLFGSLRVNKHTPLPSEINEPAPQNAGEYFAGNVPILVLDNLKNPAVVPEEPAYVEEVSDDESPAIDIATDDYKVKKKQDWCKQRPFRVAVKIQVDKLRMMKSTITAESLKTTATTDNVATAGKKGTKKEKAKKDSVAGSSDMSIKQYCYCEVPAAIQEMYSLANNHGDSKIWIIGYNSSLILQNLATSRLSQYHEPTETFASPGIREAFAWSRVFKSLPTFNDHVRLLEGSDTGCTLSVGNHLRKLFPTHISKGTVPNALVIIGGELRADKLRIIDELVTMVDTILLVGEIALPFIALSSTVKLVQHNLQCAKYTTICKALLMKARVAGCELVWPKDILAGEKELTPEEKQHCYNNILPDARNEGMDYEPEVKTFPTMGTSAEQPLLVYGYIYDIGPETIKSMKEHVQKADLVMMWGTAGAVEMNSFQAGTQALVDAIATKKPPVPLKDELTSGYWSTTREGSPRYSLVVGDGAAEWFRRMLDSDGELVGDLVGAGMLSYLSSDSRIICGLLGMYNSDMLCFGLHYRPAMENEWIYSKRKVEEEEEEEEEEDEEEEDDEDDEDDDT